MYNVYTICVCAGVIISSTGSVHEQLLLCGARRSDGTQLPRTPREDPLLLLQPHHQQGQTAEIPIVQER